MDDGIELLVSLHPFDANLFTFPRDVNGPIRGIEESAVQRQAAVSEVEHPFPGPAFRIIL